MSEYIAEKAAAKDGKPAEYYKRLDTTTIQSYTINDIILILIKKGLISEADL